MQRLRTLLDNTKGKVVRQELSCTTKLKRAENRMSLLKMEHNDLKDLTHNEKLIKKKIKNENKNIINLRTTLKKQAKKCTHEIEKLNRQLRQCQRGL